MIDAFERTFVIDLIFFSVFSLSIHLEESASKLIHVHEPRSFFQVGNQ